MKTKTKNKHQPKVTIRDKGTQCVRVEFTFPDGRGGLVEFFFAVYGDDGPTQGCVGLYHFDEGVRVFLPSNLPHYGGVTTEPTP